VAARVLAGTCLLVAFGLAHAAGHGDENPATGAHAAAAQASGPATASSAASTPVGDVDPLETLRRRLAEKLGAVPEPSTRSPYMVRVANKAIAEPAVRAARNHPAAAEPAVANRADSGLPSPGALPVPHDIHWAYNGEGGPQAWGALKPEFAQCAAGQRQSPIDIRDGIRVDLAPVQFDYRQSGFSVVDNGHTVQVNVAPGNSITVMGRRYDLVQFHFHKPSEERINGRQFDMVAHLVHKDADGHLAVVAVLLQRGSAQPLVQAIWNNLPLEKGQELAAPDTIDLNQLLPQDKRYYTYMGSLTTPPCTEGVLWMVMKQPVQVSTDQIDIFSRLYPMNARPIQSASGRLIKESE
jgi:carbonic anhydrase